VAEYEMPQEHIVDTINSFGLRILRQLSLKPDNIFISPMAVITTLAFLLNGASHTTFDEMTGSLGFRSSDLNVINQAGREVLKKIRAVSAMENANSIWLRPDIPFQEQYVAHMRTWFDFQCGPFNPAVINNWVTQQTAGKITNVLWKMSADTTAVLVNAVTLKCRWAQKFISIDGEHEFNAGPNCGPQSVLQCAYIQQTGTFEYAEDQLLQAVKLPLREKLFAVVVLPKPHTEDQGFNIFKWNVLWNRLQWREGDVVMPKLKFAYDVNLKGQLKGLGMVSMFKAGVANFSKVSPYPFQISSIIHKTFLEFEEPEDVDPSLASNHYPVPTSSFYMKVDRPYYFFVSDAQGSLFFTGNIRNPNLTANV